MNRQPASMTFSEEDYEDLRYRDGVSLFQLEVTCLDWHDGGGSAMSSFAHRKPVRADKLLAEAASTLAHCVTTKEVPRLEALVAFAETEVAQRRALIAIEKHIKAALAAGVADYRVRGVCERAIQLGAA